MNRVGGSSVISPQSASLAGQNGSIAFVASSSAIPMIQVSSGSMGNNGALTGVTSLPSTFAKCYLYLPASAISAGSTAGWYYAQMSSATAGTVFNNTYTSGTPTVPASPLAFATTGPGAFTGDTTEQGVLVSIPANGVGPNGRIVIDVSFANNNTAGTKTRRVRWGGIAGTVVVSGADTTSIGLTIRGAAIANRGATGAQELASGIFSSSASFSLPTTTTATVDTTAAQTVAISVQKGTATDNCWIEDYSVVILPG